jgi:hypothetical protein
MKAEQDAYDCRHREHGDPARSDRIAGNAHQVSHPVAEVQARKTAPMTSPRGPPGPPGLSSSTSSLPARFPAER